MNRPIRRLAAVAALMFVALLVNLCVFAIAREPGLDSNPLNRRERDVEFAQDRGLILVGDVPVATTTPVKDPFAYQRGYPQGSLYAPAVGYYSYDYGRGGLELTYNKELAGTSSTQWFDRVVDTATGAKPKGAFVQTTLNAAMQTAAVKAMGSYRGAVVALDPKTGAVLAYASLPTYDPNALASHDLAAAKAAAQAYEKAAERPMSDRAGKEIYPPGSTFKLVTAAAALENGFTADTLIDAPAQLKLPNSTAVLGNQSNCGGDKINLDQALRVSCNTAFANVGATLGPDKLRTQAEKFGFGTAQLTDLRGATSRFPAKPDQAQTMMSAIGQYEVAASPLQMAMVVSGIVNDGVVKRPYLVSEVRSPELRVLYRHVPEDQRAMGADNARLLQQMMINTVKSGTGTRAQVNGVVVGGKTGTAQSDPARPPYAWFVAFAKDPDVVVAVFIENADVERSDIAGGRLAGPVAKAVIEASR
ncbi:MAG TPA: penicillin-binding protein 2 [Propionibacteriaceae bacterium]|nr:penicillin-binding protein 2 [Propionibacteriaceae bacterium]HPZ48429.1 penicillin-binding protein 2 [Propionibacteriaceae bacterium]HQE31113.1 penicillin-binding protein 2 [Propionibacteriaceae bacterium]